MFRLSCIGFEDAIQDASLPELQVFVGEGFRLWNDLCCDSPLVPLQFPPEEHRTRTAAVFLPHDIPVPEVSARVVTFDFPVDFQHPAKLYRSSSSASQVLVLQFAEQLDCDRAYEALHGKPFSTERQEHAIVLFLAVPPKVTSALGGDSPKSDSSGDYSDPVSRCLQDMHSQPIAELPTCMFCLERLEASVSGVLTSMCSHTESCGCVMRPKVRCGVCSLLNAPYTVAAVSDGGCDAGSSPSKLTPSKVATPTPPPTSSTSTSTSTSRSTNTVDSLEYDSSPSHPSECGSPSVSATVIEPVPATSVPTSSLSATAAQTLCCAACGNTPDLWVCLVCGFVGCGRYQEGKHSHTHFMQTNHRFAAEIDSQMVWDYLGDRYVHRIIHRSSEPLSLPDFNDLDEGPASACKELADAKLDGKLESTALEFTHLLNHQLASQRLYFNELIQSKAMEHTQQLSIAQNELETATRELHDLEASTALAISQAEADAVDEQTKQTQLKDRAEKLKTDIASLRTELQTEQSNAAELQIQLSSVTEKAAATKKALASDVADLKQQLADLQFFVSANKIVGKHKDKEGIQGGVVIVADGASSSPAASASAAKKKPRGRR